jgi:flagellar hook-length control protein FliK
MVGSVSIQANTGTQAHASALAPAGSGGSSSASFAGMLSDFVQKKHGAAAPGPVAAKPGSPVAEAATPDPGEAKPGLPLLKEAQPPMAASSRPAEPALTPLQSGNNVAVMAALPAVGLTTGKAPAATTAPHRKVVVGSGPEILPGALSPDTPPPPAIMLTALALPSGIQARPGHLGVPTPPPAAVAAATPHTEATGAQKAADSHRDDPATQPARPENSASMAPTVVSSGTDAKLEQSAAISETISAAVALASGAGASQSLSAVSEPASLPAVAQDQPAAAAGYAAPADQVAPALVGMLKTADGVHSVTVMLRPAELGPVQIRIDQSTDGAARVNVTAERPETLELLQRDQPRLMQALDQAGVPADGRVVTFQVAPPEQQVSASASRPDSMAAGSGDLGQGQSGNARRQNDDSYPGSGASQDQGQGQARARWFRAGLDITA